MIINIYRLPSGPISQFQDELGDFLATLVTSSSDKFLLCGDLNCPGVDGAHADDDLQNLLDSLVLDILVNEPTCANNLLDILASDDPGLVSETYVDDAGLLSDHCLVHCKIRLDRPESRPVTISFRRTKDINIAEFEDCLRRSDLFRAPASKADAFADQL